MSTSSSPPTTLRRYTDMPSLLHILYHRQLTLLSPTTWDDRNDRNMLAAFAAANRLRACVALCFSQATETYHHWKVFAPGASGVCIEFLKDPLLRRLETIGLIHGEVEYKSVKDLLLLAREKDMLPFLKRTAFSDEDEYRVVYGSQTEGFFTRGFEIDLDSIRRVFINPWMAPELYSATKQLILSVPGCSRLKVVRSTLIDNENWRHYASEFVAPGV